MRRRGGLGLIVAAFVVVGGCHPVRPDIVGVPHQGARSPDVELPLTARARAELERFLGREPRRISPGQVAAAYGALLDALMQAAPTDADLTPGGRLAQLVDDPTWILRVHDARTQYDFVGRAYVKGDVVFAFYALPPLAPVFLVEGDAGWIERPTPPGTDARRSGVLWVDPTRGGLTSGRVYTALVVFAKTFAVSTEPSQR